MRLWSIHPAYLDSRGLVALWREGLLALAVLEGKTRGYRHHPQLERFRSTSDPAAAARGYLWYVYDEAVARQFRFDPRRIGRRRAAAPPMTVTRGQLRYEIEHLKAKLLVRDPARLHSLESPKNPRPHPSFSVVAGSVAGWERAR